MSRVKSVLDVLVTVLVVVAAGLVIWRQLTLGGQWESPQARSPVENATGKIPAELATNARGVGQVALVEFGDFECPFCGQHTRDVEPLIREAFVDTGIVRHVFVHYPLSIHRRAQPASEAAICASNQGKFWEMHEALFRNQTALDEMDLTARADEIGLDLVQFSHCLSNGEARPVVEQHRAAARALNVQATPAFFVGIVQPDGSVELKKRINGAVPFSEFRETIIDLTPAAWSGSQGGSRRACAVGDNSRDNSAAV